MRKEELQFLDHKYSELFEIGLSTTLKVREIQIRTKMFNEGGVTPELDQAEKNLDLLACSMTDQVITAKKTLKQLKPDV